MSRKEVVGLSLSKSIIKKHLVKINAEGSQKSGNHLYTTVG